MRASSPQRRHSSSSSAKAVSESAATISRTAAAPASAASQIWQAIDDEILAQHRQVDRRGDGAQILERAAEARGLGEHRDRVGAGLFVGARLRHRVQMGGDLALARRAPLDLGDEGEGSQRPAGAAARRRRGERLDEAAAGAAGRGAGERRLPARLGGAPAGAGDHLGEEVAHADAALRRLVVAMRASSLARAAPEATAARAAATPSSMVATGPAM